MSGSRDTYRAGLIAEIVAAAYLILKGYSLIGWRAKTPVGEIDFIAAKRNVLIFVEVKLRKASETALYAVSAKNQSRVTRAALYLSARRPDWQGKDMRFDVIALSWPFFIRHIDNAWRPQA